MGPRGFGRSPASLGAIALALLWAASPFACAKAVAPPAEVDAGPPPPPACAGEAMSCEGRGFGTCKPTLGCTSSGWCTGTPTACNVIFDNFACKQQSGCTWSDGFMASCKGTSTACNFLSNSPSCKQQTGCVWETSCAGAPTPCNEMPSDACTTQPGCFTSEGGGAACVDASDCSPQDDPCYTGECLDGACVRTPGCVACTTQADCAEGDDLCATGDCVNGVCGKKPGCHLCVNQEDCTPAVDACNTGNCINGTCEPRTNCTAGDGCCPPGCDGIDGDCD